MLDVTVGHLMLPISVVQTELTTFLLPSVASTVMEVLQSHRYIMDHSFWFCRCFVERSDKAKISFIIIAAK